MRAKILLEQALKAVVQGMGLAWPAKAQIEPPKDAAHGDMATNLALLLNKEAGMPPRDLAGKIAENLRDTLKKQGVVLQTEVAGPGFVNITFAPSFWQAQVGLVEEQGDNFGKVDIGHAQKVQVEFVSANPTGPLHIGHGRGAAVGDSLARLLAFSGYDVSTEYYINDAGLQMRLLGLSIYLRMRELAGLHVDWPESWYKGEYIIDIAKEMVAKNPNWQAIPEADMQNACYEYGKDVISQGIIEDLDIFRVHHDKWFSEKSLVDAGKVEAVLEDLEKRGLAYHKDGALWFSTMPYGDDKDRVLRKSDGTLTYLASDIAYHADKYARGLDICIDIWGADHHGYIKRMEAGIQAIGYNPATNFGVLLIQLVNLLRNGQPVAMSTRSGEFVTLKEVLDEVGTDAARFLFLSRKSDSPLDFDLELAKQRNLDNPVYYVQYAHARIAALLRRAEERGIQLPVTHDAKALACLNAPQELALLRAMDSFEDVVAESAVARAPHSISHYLMDIAGQVHSYYAATPILTPEITAESLARLALLRAVGQTIHNALGLLGVYAPESM